MAPTTRNSKGLKETTSTPFGPPFDDADADTILRSSDQVDFYVYRVILSKASPFFKSMFSLPQPDSQAGVSEKQIPIISLTENSKTIAVLLASIHPTVAAKFVQFVPLDVMIDALVAAKKYDMDVISHCLVQKFAMSKAMQDSPVEAFCLAYSHELGEAARVAAKASLKHRLSLDDIGDKLQYTNGPGLHQLWKFHHACSATAVEVVSNNHILVEQPYDGTWWDFKDTSCRSSGSECRKYRYKVGPSDSWDSWDATAPWHDYITRAHNVLLEHPCSEAVTNYSLLKPSYNKHVEKMVMLSKTSPFFKSMFSLPQPDTGVSEKQTSIISLTENSRTIAVLLSSIYPTVPTKFVPLDVMTDALVAARKYDMDVVSQCLVQKFAESEVMRDSPVEAFCAACSHELGEATRVAAKASLKHRLNLDIIAHKLPYLNGPALHQLWKFHRACSATAAKAASDTHLTWITPANRTWWDFVQDKCSQVPNVPSISTRWVLPADTPGTPPPRGTTTYHALTTSCWNILARRQWPTTPF
ncbi:hypothetical protein EDB92DRAFT_1940134 [Lactarius akahatsu]|uniref:BTB domain-containing protein n=1 Tax=Lactarius akahatsu TaxID=416441 RepID=A0AAD4LQS9_9AGAM|nr:hypothetical protein EDB92DRAFT_1940134 [Lactarius akahatsu]